MREFIGALNEGEWVSYLLEYKRSLVSKILWVHKFRYDFKLLTVIYTFYLCSSAVSNTCHILKRLFKADLWSSSVQTREV